MSKYIKLYPQKNVSNSLKSDENIHKKVISIDLLRLAKYLRLFIGLALTVTLLILAYKTEYFYFQKITQVLFIVGSILMIKYLAESKTKNKIN